MYEKQKVLRLVSSCLEKQNFRASTQAHVPVNGHTCLMTGPQVTHEQTRDTWGWGQIPSSTLYDTLRMPSRFLISEYLIEYRNLGMLVSWPNSLGLGLIIRCGGAGWRGWEQQMWWKKKNVILENIFGEMVLFRVGGGKFGRAARKGYRSWLRRDLLRDVSQGAMAGYCWQAFRRKALLPRWFCPWATELPQMFCGRFHPWYIQVGEELSVGLRFKS